MQQKHNYSIQQTFYLHTWLCTCIKHIKTLNQCFHPSSKEFNKAGLKKQTNSSFTSQAAKQTPETETETEKNSYWDIELNK